MTAPDRLVRRYLDALDRALSGLPEPHRWEIVDDVTEHIRTSRAELPGDGTEAEVRTILDRLGDPGLIAARAREEAGEAPPAAAPARRDPRDTISVLLLTLGALLLPLVGPAVALLLVAGSPRWTSRRKLEAFAVPAGLIAGLALLVFLVQGYWRVDLLFIGAVLVPAGAGIALAVPPARAPISRNARTAGHGVIAALLLGLSFAASGWSDYYGLAGVVVLAALALGRFGIAEGRRPAYA